MDLLDWYRGRLTTRRLAVLVRHLPRDSALTRELVGEAAEWTVTDHLLAHIADQLAEANWMFATVNRDEDTDPIEYPAPFPRPGAEDSPSAAAPEAEPALQRPSPAELTRFFSD
ncbi:hypothetical protein [Streptomyces sp. NPDC052225]|uniref:hypothetical protein n=1 Tax=Streptomyces sp. NPDC052225 TaxID=3154949 RepID=UPI003414FDEC